MIGNILLWLSLGMTIIAAAFISRYKIARFLVSIQFISVILLLFFLLIGILSGWYNISYIYHNSSSTLPMLYKISTLWAGDAGSLIVWLALLSLLSFTLFFRLSISRLTVISILVLQILIIASVIALKPFVSVLNVTNGLGMNLLLQNPWMILHPPIIFASYALLAVPFGLTISYLWRPNLYNHKFWRDMVIPWILASWMLLGIGIAIGAIWSYEVLGWGGYWGWDPVENSSLIPWILLTVALHSLHVDETTEGNVRTSAASILGAFLSMIIAVFITRSGILSSISVHAFADSSLFIILLVGVLLTFVISIYLFIKAYKMLPHAEEPSLTSRPFWMGVGNQALIVFSILVLTATLWPAISGLFGVIQVPSRTFYQTMLIPITMAILVGCAIAAITAWKVTNPRFLIRALVGPILVGLLFITFLLSSKMSDPIMVSLGFLALFMMTANVNVMGKVKWPRWGAYLSHIGLALLVLGITVSSIYQSSGQTTLIANGKGSLVLDFEAKLVSFVEDYLGSSYKASYSLVYKEKNYKGEIVGQWSEFDDAWISKPSISRSIMRDIIVAPGEPIESIEFKLGLGDTLDQLGYKVNLEKINEESVYFKLSYDSGDFKIDASLLKMVEVEKDVRLILADLTDGIATIKLIDMREGKSGTIRLPITITVRYWVGFVWIGMILIIIGILWALLRRILKKSPVSTIPQPVKNQAGGMAIS